MVSRNILKVGSTVAPKVVPKVGWTTLKTLIPTTIKEFISRSQLPQNTISKLYNNLESNLNKGYLKFSQQANALVSPLSEPSKGKVIIDLITKGPLGSLESNGATITKYLTDINAHPTFVTNIGTIANALRWISSVYLLIELITEKENKTDDKIIDETIDGLIKKLNETSPEPSIPTIQKNESKDMLKKKIDEMNAFIMTKTEDIDIPDIDLIHILMKLLEEKDEIIEKMEQELINNQEIINDNHERIINLDMELCQCQKPTNHEECEHKMDQVEGGGYFSKRRKSHKRRKNKKKRTRKKSLKKLF